MLFLLYTIVGLSVGILVTGGVYLLRGQNRRHLPPCAARPQVLDLEERALFNIIERLMGAHARVMPKISLGSVVDPVEPVSDLEAHKRRLARQHLDYLLCSPSTMAPVGVVQLVANKKRSAVVARALESAGIPVLYLERGTRHDPAQLRMQLHMLISGRRIESRDRDDVVPQPDWTHGARQALTSVRAALAPITQRIKAARHPAHQ